MAKLNEEQAWRLMALIFCHAPGICNVITSLHNNDLVSNATVDKLRARMQQPRPAGTLPKKESVYWWPTVRYTADGPRMEFALKQAARVRRQRRRRG